MLSSEMGNTAPEVKRLAYNDAVIVQPVLVPTVQTIRFHLHFMMVVFFFSWILC